ncbi:MAG: T9SS type A sorting domain-containing protein, partial [Nonlabens sp.]|nr:T9SS type A sorting domain-containing protein [Nonlabens sp.]
VTHWLMTMGAGTHINGAYTTNTDDYAIFRFDDQGTYLGQTPVNMIFTNGRPAYSAVLTMDEVLNRYYISAYRRLGTGNSIDFLGSPINNNVALGAVDATNGNVLWRMENTGGNNFTGIYDLKVDGQSNVYLSGRSFNTVANPDSFAGYPLDHIQLSGGGSPGPYLIKLNAQGGLLWGSSPVYGAESGGYKIALNNNEVALATALRISGNWGSQTYTRSGSWQDDPVVVRFNTTTGNVLGIEDILAPAGSQEMATAIATDNFGNYVVGGYMRSTLFQNVAGITPLQINGSGATDFWYARLATTDCAGVPLSIEEDNLSKVSIFPNPATDFVQVNSNAVITSYSIYTISGQQVLSGSMDDTHSIEVLSLTSGIYLLNLESDGGR